MLLVLGVLGIAWFLFWFASSGVGFSPAEGGHNGPAGPRSDAPHPPHREPEIPAPLQRMVRRQEVPESNVVLRVRGGGGEPVNGARVSRCPLAGARNLAESDIIGMTDQNGEFRLVKEDVERIVDAARLAVYARGYVLTSIDLPHAPGVYEVSLDRGSRLELVFRDFHGKELEGMSAAVSMARFPWGSVLEEDARARGPGSDPIGTIWHARSDESGSAVFESLLPGRYYLRAESADWIPVSGQEGRMVVELPGAGARHEFKCGRICIAAIQTSVPPSEVLSYWIRGSGSHVDTGSTVEMLSARQRKIESQFPGCHAIVSLAPGVAEDLGVARFHYQTLAHGEFEHELPFVPLGAFVRPSLYSAPARSRLPHGEVCVRLAGDHGIAREKLRVRLKRRAGDIDGILCVEGEPRLVPAGTYVVDFETRAMAQAVAPPGSLHVEPNAKLELGLRIKEELVPLTVIVQIPESLRGEIVNIDIAQNGARLQRGRTRTGEYCAWVREGVYEVTADVLECRPASTSVIVRRSEPASLVLKCEREQ